ASDSPRSRAAGVGMRRARPARPRPGGVSRGTVGRGHLPIGPRALHLRPGARPPRAGGRRARRRARRPGSPGRPWPPRGPDAIRDRSLSRQPAPSRHRRHEHGPLRRGACALPGPPACRARTGPAGRIEARSRAPQAAAPRRPRVRVAPRRVGPAQDGLHLPDGPLDPRARARAAGSLPREQAAGARRRRKRVGGLRPGPRPLVAPMGTLRAEPARVPAEEDVSLPIVERCPVCGGDRIDPYAMDAWAPPALHFAQARCTGCGLLISQPQASEAEMEAYYGHSYFEEQWPDSDAIWRQNTEVYKRYELPLMRELWADWPPPLPAAAAEVGCGYGVMLGALRDAGFRTQGCDLSA